MSLVAGAFVDVCDWGEEWRAAQVKRVDSNGDILFRFPGWCLDHEELIRANEIATQTAPLYSRSYPRDEWLAGDKVDFLCCQKYKVWVQATVVEANHGKGTVNIQLPKESVRETLELHRSPVSESDLKFGLVKDVNILSDFIAPLHTFTTKLSRKYYDATITRRTLPTHAPVASASFVSSAIDSATVPPAIRTEKKKRKYENTASKPCILPVPEQPTTLVSWLAPLLKARNVSNAHIQLCEKALVEDEGFTTAEVFAAAAKSELNLCFTRNGIYAVGLLLHLRTIHETLQASAKVGGGSGGSGV